MGKHKKKPSAPGNKGRHKWATATQEEYLNSQISGYLSSQASNDSSDFWPPIWKHFFGQWPLPLLTPKEKEDGKADHRALTKKKERIKQWFNNHTRESYTGEKKKKLLNLSVKKPKLLPDWQAYSILYYETRVKEIVQDEWPAERARILERKANGEDVKDPPDAAPLWFRNKWVRAEFATETDEVKEEVDKWRQGQLEGGTHNGLDEDVDIENAKRASLATARAKAQSLVGETVTRVLEQVREQTGYIGVVALAGPDVRRGGEIKMLLLYSGQTPLGHDFGHLYGAKKWKQSVLGPLGQFAEKVYPPEIRKSWAQVPDPDVDTIVGSGPPSRMTTVDPVRHKVKPTGTAAKSPSVASAKDSRKERWEDDVAGYGSEGDGDGEDNGDSEDDAPFDLIQSGDSTAEEDNLKTPTQKAPTTQANEVTADPHGDWDNGEPLTNEERKAILAMGSNYERSKEMNKRKNARRLAELDLRGEVVEMLEGLKDAEGKSEKLEKPNAKQKSDAELTKSTSPGVSDRVTRSHASSRTTPKRVASQARPTAAAPATVPLAPSVLSQGQSAQGNSPSRPKSANPVGVVKDAVGGLTNTHPLRERWPSWMSPAIAKLETYSNHPEWKKLLESWLEFEDKLGYPYGQAKTVIIDKTNRPEEINIWLKYGRKLNGMPDLSPSVSEFSATWKKWWSHLQPEWRGTGPEFSTDIRGFGTWHELQKGGQNGFYLVLLSYCWWGAAASDEHGNGIEPTYSEWLDAFLDIAWVLDKMIEDLNHTEKQKGAKKRGSKRSKGDQDDEVNPTEGEKPASKRRKTRGT